MARAVGRGEIWLLERAAPDHRRPVLVLSRPALLRVLNTAMVVAITSSAHGSPTEVELGVDEGLKHPSWANFAHVFTVRQSELRRYVATVGTAKMKESCRALAMATGCD